MKLIFLGPVLYSKENLDWVKCSVSPPWESFIEAQNNGEDLPSIMVMIHCEVSEHWTQREDLTSFQREKQDKTNRFHFKRLVTRISLLS